MLECRVLFDGLVKQYGEKYHCIINYLSNNEDDGFFTAFEGAVLRSLQNQEIDAHDQLLLEGFKTQDKEVEEECDFATKLLNVSQMMRSGYQDLSWIPPSSNHIERFFSKAKFFMGSHRCAMTPEHFEAQLFLHVNKTFWDVNTIQALL